MSEELNSYMLKTAKGDKEYFRFIANTVINQVFVLFIN